MAENKQGIWLNGNHVLIQRVVTQVLDEHECESICRLWMKKMDMEWIGRMWDELFSFEHGGLTEEKRQKIYELYQQRLGESDWQCMHGCMEDICAEEEE